MIYELLIGEYMKLNYLLIWKKNISLIQYEAINKDIRN
jgi:hypothetical protein